MGSEASVRGPRRGGDREWSCVRPQVAPRHGPTRSSGRGPSPKESVDDPISTISACSWRLPWWQPLRRRRPCRRRVAARRPAPGQRAGHQRRAGPGGLDQRPVAVGRQRGRGLQGRPRRLHRQDRHHGQLRGRPPDVLHDAPVAHHRWQPAGYRDHPGHRLPAALRQGRVAQEGRRPRRRRPGSRPTTRRASSVRDRRRRAVCRPGQVQQQGHDVVSARPLQDEWRHHQPEHLG